MTAITEHGIYVWRMSAPGDGRSMWYDREGRFNPIDPAVEVLSMPIDLMRVVLNKSATWLSSVESPDLLDVWFPAGLQQRLRVAGFVTHKFFVRHYFRLPNEIVFKAETATEVDDGDPR